MNDQHPRAEVYPGRRDRVLVVGAGPVGAGAALLLADYGVPVTLLERYTEPHPLPRAVHLDDEVARTVGRIGIGEGFLARSRPCSGLRLLDAQHRVMAEFRREHEVGVHGFPQANMFHQPELEELMFARIGQHPLIDLRRGAEVCGMDGALGPLTADPVRVHMRLAADGTTQTFTGRLVLGCDGATSTIRRLAGIRMDDLGFTERWLVVDIRVPAPLATWDGVEQICDPARAATFMQVTGDRYRWEFQLRDGEDEADLITPPALGRLLQPWTGRDDLGGLEIIRSATYTFRARMASRFQAGRMFLLGDAAHLTPPFIGQGLAAGLRDADNLAWKIAYVLTGRAGEDLLATYDTERRPHARAMIKKAVRVGWAMTGGQDRAAAVRRVALAAAVRSARFRDAMASTRTPCLKAGALRHPPRRIRLGRAAVARTGALVPNALVTTGDGAPVRLDAVLRGRAAVLTAGQPGTGLLSLCQRHHLLLIQVSTVPPPGVPRHAPGPAQKADRDWVEVKAADDSGTAALQALIGDPQVSVLVRPDRVIADVATAPRLPSLPWSVPATAIPGRNKDSRFPNVINLKS
ncbi:MAG: bifunctional 3-(3-hydroxy-phenyl)propionate/3-hydroxycinnamic acid hydroxylase [Micromonosporaceae bacterium]